MNDKCFDTENLTLDTRSHAFNVGIAKDFSTTMALWLAHLAFWAEKNLANNTNIHDGLVWCFDTIEALADYFPYLTKSQRETMINNSVKHGLVVTGNYNQTTYDRTVWYALTPKAYFYFQYLLTEKNLKRLFFSISENSEMDFSEFGNRFPNFRMTIPDTDPDTDPDKESGGLSPHHSKNSVNKFPTPKQRNSKASFESPELQSFFNTKFSGLDVTYKKLFDDCTQHYDSKNQWVTTKKWKQWLEREKTENYKKISAPKQKPSFTQEELELVSSYNHAVKYNKLDTFMPDKEKQARAKGIIARMKAKEANACQTSSQPNSVRANCLKSASSLVSHLS